MVFDLPPKGNTDKARNETQENVRTETRKKFVGAQIRTEVRRFEVLRHKKNFRENCPAFGLF